MNKELYLDKNAVAHWLHSLELHQRVVVKVTRESSLVRGTVVVSGGLSNLLEMKPCAATRQVKVAMHTKPTKVKKRHLLRQRRGRHATESSAPALSNCMHDALLVAGLDHLAMERIHATKTRKCLRLDFERAAPPKTSGLVRLCLTIDVAPKPPTLETYGSCQDRLMAIQPCSRVMYNLTLLTWVAKLRLTSHVGPLFTQACPNRSRGAAKHGLPLSSVRTAAV
jgi:hypothetical protein